MSTARRFRGSFRGSFRANATSIPAESLLLFLKLKLKLNLNLNLNLLLLQELSEPISTRDGTATRNTAESDAALNSWPSFACSRRRQRRCASLAAVHSVLHEEADKCHPNRSSVQVNHDQDVVDRGGFHLVYRLSELISRGETGRR